jgi:hypothetical protein
MHLCDGYHSNLHSKYAKICVNMQIKMHYYYLLNLFNFKMYTIHQIINIQQKIYFKIQQQYFIYFIELYGTECCIEIKLYFEHSFI